MMTVTDLGNHVRKLHPTSYSHIPPHVLGRALKAKHPDLYSDVADVKPKNMDAGTIPELPKTLMLQLGQLKDGIRRCVFVARGSKIHPNAKDFDARKLTLPSGEYYYRPEMIKPQEIIAAVRNHELNEILGSAQSGYGSASKEELQGPVKSVMAKDSDGETIQGVLSDPEHEDSAIAAAHEVTPAGGTVSVEPPENEIKKRLQYRRPGAGGRWPAPKTPTSQGIPHQEI